MIKNLSYVNKQKSSIAEFLHKTHVIRYRTSTGYQTNVSPRRSLLPLKFDIGLGFRAILCPLNPNLGTVYFYPIICLLFLPQEPDFLFHLLLRFHNTTISLQWCSQTELVIDRLMGMSVEWNTNTFMTLLFRILTTTRTVKNSRLSVSAHQPD